MAYKIEHFLRNGLLCIEDLLATKDYDLIAEAFETCSTSQFEITSKTLEEVDNCLKAGEWSRVLMYAVVNNHIRLAHAVLNRNEEYCSRYLEGIRQDLARTPIQFSKGTESNAHYLRIPRGDYSTILSSIAECKQRILAELALELDMNRTIEGLDEAYFKRELSKGNFEIVIIKLCVRLEAILKGKYHLEGEFSEMLEKYCSTYGRDYDDWHGCYKEAEWVKTLQKLRMCRNNIVHPENNQIEALTLAKLEFCIDYICNKI